MAEGSGLGDSIQIWLALATSGLVLLGFSSLAASMAAPAGGKLRRRQIFGIRAITSNSLYLSFLSFLPLLLLQLGPAWEPACALLRGERLLDCAATGGYVRTHVWSLTSLAAIAGLAWQISVQIWRILLVRDFHDSIRILVFYLLPAPFIVFTQLGNLDANLMPLALFGTVFFAWAACGHFYLFLHRLGAAD